MYTLLTDISQEVRVTEPDRVDERCTPYLAELNSLLGKLRPEPVTRRYPDWLIEGSVCFFVTSEILGRSSPFIDTVALIDDVQSRELNERTNELYLLLMDIVQEAQQASRGEIRRRCLPYRPELKQLIAQIEALAVRRQQQKDV